MFHCEECNGERIIEKDGKLYDCECSIIKRIEERMPMQIKMAEVLQAHLSLPIVSSVDASAFIKGSYSDIKAIIKATMIKYPNKWIRLTTDVEIRNVYVGSMSKSSKKDDFNGEIYNNIQDLIDPPDLVIIQLNVISNKNKAAPGALEEALNHRLINSKPIWALSTYENPFTDASFSYSSKVDEIIQTGLVQVTIPKINKPQNSMFRRDGELILEKTPDKKKIEHGSKEFSGKPETSDSKLSVWGSGVKKNKKSFGDKDN